MCHLYHGVSIFVLRGSAPDVPEFPSKLDWLNTAPLQFHRVVSNLALSSSQKNIFIARVY